MNIEKVSEYLSIFEITFDDVITKDIILARFKFLSKKYHPDTAEDKYKDGKMFILLCEAKDFLLANIDKFYKNDKEELETDDPRIKEFLNKAQGFVSSNEPEKATIDGVTYVLDIQKLMMLTTNYLLRQLREYGLTYNQSFVLSTTTLLYYLKTNFPQNLFLWFGYLFSSVSSYLLNIDYSKVDIDKAISDAEVELSDEEIVLRKISKICSQIKVSQDLPIAPIIDSFSLSTKLDEKDSVSTYVKSYIISRLARNIKEFKITGIEKFSLFANKILPSKTFSDSTVQNIEKTIYESEAILRFFGEDLFNHYNDARNYNDEEQEKFVAALNSGLQVLNYSLVDFSKLCKALKNKTFSDSITNNEIVKMAGFSFILENYLAAYCKVIGLNPNVSYAKSPAPKSIPTPQEEIGFMIHNFNQVISNGLLNSTQTGKVPHRNVDEVISLLQLGDSFNGYQEKARKQRENQELAQKAIQEYQQSKNQPKAGCYIATAVYGSYDCPEVWVLRRFRDYKLKQTLLGRLFVKVYYSISPSLVRIFGKTKWFQAIWKHKLDKMVSKLHNKGFEDSPYKD